MTQGIDRGRPEDVSRIREQVEVWAKAVRARDIDGIIARHAEGILLFDVPRPVQSWGLEAYRSSWQDQFFPWFGDSGVFELDELQITAGDDVAFCHGLVRCSGTESSGLRTDELTVRLTIGLLKNKGGRLSMNITPSRVAELTFADG